MMLLIVIALVVLPGLISDVCDTLQKRKGKLKKKIARVNIAV